MNDCVKDIMIGLEVASDALSIASDHGLHEVDICTPKHWGLQHIGGNGFLEFCSVSGLSKKLDELSRSNLTHGAIEEIEGHERREDIHQYSISNNNGLWSVEINNVIWVEEKEDLFDAVKMSLEECDGAYWEGVSNWMHED